MPAPPGGLTLDPAATAAPGSSARRRRRVQAFPLIFSHIGWLPGAQLGDSANVCTKTSSAVPISHPALRPKQSPPRQASWPRPPSPDGTRERPTVDGACLRSESDGATRRLRSQRAHLQHDHRYAGIAAAKIDCATPIRLLQMIHRRRLHGQDTDPAQDRNCPTTDDHPQRYANQPATAEYRESDRASRPFATTVPRPRAHSVTPGAVHPRDASGRRHLPCSRNRSGSACRFRARESKGASLYVRLRCWAFPRHRWPGTKKCCSFQTNQRVTAQSAC